MIPALAHAEPVGPATALQIDADHLELVHGAHELHLRGKVRVRAGGTPRGEVSIEASRMVVRLDDKGTPVALDAQGPVTFLMGDSRGVARRLQLRLRKQPRSSTSTSPSAGSVELVGDARLDLGRPRLTVAGERIWLDLESGRMTVHRARVDLAPARSAAPSAAARQAGGQGHGG